MATVRLSDFITPRRSPLNMFPFVDFLLEICHSEFYVWSKHDLISLEKYSHILCFRCDILLFKQIKISLNRGGEKGKGYSSRCFYPCLNTSFLCHTCYEESRLVTILYLFSYCGGGGRGGSAQGQGFIFSLLKFSLKFQPLGVASHDWFFNEANIH